MRIFLIICFFIFTAVSAVSQDSASFRGSIPEELLRPARGEAPRYPVDMVIGSLGRGEASEAAFSFANSAASALISRQVSNPALSSVSAALRENYLSAINVISPESFRIGGGKQEADGSFSFLIRFIGRDQGITGEMYIRYVTRQTGGSWVLEDLFLDDPVYRDIENQESMNRRDFYFYERFF